MFFLQAWACGKPVISFVDPDGVIRRNKLGYVVGDKQEAVQVIEQASGDECGARLEAISINAMNYLSENHAANKIIEQLSEKIIGLLGRVKSVATGN